MVVITLVITGMTQFTFDSHKYKNSHLTEI